MSGCCCLCGTTSLTFGRNQPLRYVRCSPSLFQAERLMLGANMKGQNWLVFAPRWVPTAAIWNALHFSSLSNSPSWLILLDLIPLNDFFFVWIRHFNTLFNLENCKGGETDSCACIANLFGCKDLAVQYFFGFQALCPTLSWVKLPFLMISYILGLIIESEL